MIDSLYSNLKTLLQITWPTLVVSLVMLLSIRIAYLIRFKKEFVLYREVLLLFFVIYVLCLFQIVTAQDINLANEGNNFIPFKEIFRYDFSSNLFFKIIIGNVLLFMPYGFFLGKYGVKKSYKIALFLIFLASLSIELTQLAIGRIFDIDDIILNCLGGFIGYFIYSTLDKIFSILPKFFSSRVFLDILAVLSLVILSLIVVQIVL